MFILNDLEGTKTLILVNQHFNIFMGNTYFFRISSIKFWMLKIKSVNMILDLAEKQVKLSRAFPKRSRASLGKRISHLKPLRPGENKMKKSN